jgi:hypothetical protein
MPTGINTPLGYSARNIAGYLPRAEIEYHPLFYEDALTSSPVIFGEYEPLLVASHFGKKRKTTKKKAPKKKTTKKKAPKKKKKTTTRLRKTTGGSKRVSTTRKSPEASATTKKIGSVARGIDGNRWVVKKASNGVKRWSKISEK